MTSVLSIPNNIFVMKPVTSFSAKISVSKFFNLESNDGWNSSDLKKAWTTRLFKFLE